MGELSHSVLLPVDELGRFYSGEPDSLNDIHHSKIKGAQAPLRHLVEIQAGAEQPPQENK